MFVMFLATTVMWAMEMPRKLAPLLVHGFCLGMDSCLMTSKLPKSAGLKAKRAHEQWSQWNIVMHSVNYSICICNCKVIFFKR